MKNQTKVLGILVSLVVLFLCFTSCKNESKTPEIEKETTYNVLAATVVPCLSESSWFPHSQTPAPDEGKGSPFDVSETTNCIFHQWSWQKFLWVTKPDGDTPLFLNQSQIIQVADDMKVVAQQTGAKVVLTDTVQAGFVNGVLKTNPEYNSITNQEYTVHYSIHVSKTMLTAADEFKEALASGKLKENNFATFPVGSLELKVSWVDVNAIPSNKRANYYTTMGALSNNGGKTYTNTTVALLGMHVVGVVENHPEFIWATFEHNDIAPNYDWKANEATSTAEKLLFSKGSTTGLNGITYTKNVGPKAPHKAYDLFQYGVPLDSTGTPMATSQSEPANINHIKEINKSVASNLKDVWANYFYNGSIWLDTDEMSPKQQAKLIVDLAKKGKTGSALSGSKTRGSLNNANVSMETFTQTFNADISEINVSNLANCFSCHSGSSFSSPATYSPIYISHIFDAYIKSENEGKTKVEINTLKDKQQKQMATYIKSLK
ncbi:hypothetical protein [Lacinutrix jangbogonensis]|uniref:hypothetical protein n=1 Tax=Lacinutrix jangbogonensis TaxID=1469557 RepID=UPI00053D9441|nr:hypothetical protein [Lacinutrix jangbogonensis]